MAKRSGVNWEELQADDDVVARCGKCSAELWNNERGAEQCEHTLMIAHTNSEFSEEGEDGD